jgi:murein endopeptidase
MPNEVDVLLPKNGVGFVSRKTEATRWGTAFTIDFIIRLGAAWQRTRAGGPRLQIGDLSPKGGGPCPTGAKDSQGNPLHHKSHRDGVDFDVQIIRSDGQELFRSVQISDPSTHKPTQDLVDLIENLGGDHVEKIFTAGNKVLKGPHIRMEKDHTFHLHVRLRP